jgi:hypothetical protein
MPDIRGLAKKLRLETLEYLALLFDVLDPAAIEVISLMAVLFMASFAFSTM